MATKRLMNKKMERRRLKYQVLCIAGYALLTVFASCGQEEERTAENTLPGERVPLELAEIGLDNAVTSRAPAETEVPYGHIIGFYLKGDNGYTAVDNRRGHYESTKGKWIPDTPIYLGSNTATLAIYYPYSAGQSSWGNRLAVTSVLREKSKTNHTSSTDLDIWSDRFQANLLSCFGTNKIERKLTHIYARMFITLVKGDDFVGNGTWTKVRLEGGDVYTSAQFDPLEENKLNAYSNYINQYVNCEFDAKTVAKNTPATTDILLIPSKDMTSDLVIIVTVSGKDMKVTIPKERFTQYVTGKYRLLPEKQYNLTIILRPTDLEVSSLKTTDWDPVTVSGTHETTN